MDYFGLDLAFARRQWRPLGRPFAADCRLDSSYFAWIACAAPFGRALAAVAVAENAAEDSSSVACCLVHFRQVHSNSDYFAANDAYDVD